MQPESKRAFPDAFSGGGRYNAYGAFLKQFFGCRVAKIAVDAGFTCPNRDGSIGSGGCTYCNNDAFVPATARRTDPVPEQVQAGILYLKRRFRARKFIVYFQPYSNTHAPLEKLIPLYESALGFPEVVGIAVGTRPDCVDEEKISWFENLARSRFVTLEYGLESASNDTLARINRGHDYGCWLAAVRRTRGRGIFLCAHLILGFPWESRETTLAGADAVSGIGLDFLKLHHLHVVRDSALGRGYLERPFPLLEYRRYIDLLVDFLERLEPSIRLERLFGMVPEKHLIGPRWGKSKAEIHRDIVKTLESRDTWQGRRSRLSGDSFPPVSKTGEPES
jgi:radical SAM protein (TIGR01212 family)